MNNYDYNFNGEMLDKNLESKSKLNVKMNKLKLICYFLIMFNVFQIIFFMGYSFISFVIAVYIFYICYTILNQKMNQDDLYFDLDHKTLSDQLGTLSLNILIIIFLCILDAGVGIVFMKEILSSLFNSENNFEFYFAVFSTYLSVCRLLYLGFLFKFTKY